VTAPEILENGLVRAVVTPGLGGTVTALRHLASGIEVLARVPWTPRAAPLAFAASEEAWLQTFAGGWPLMFPNAGDACRDGAVSHGFHGEGSVSPWSAAREGGALVLERRFVAVPVTMTRRLWLEDHRLIVAETVQADGPCAVVWGQHVTFGGDLLAGPVRLATSAGRLAACATYDPAASPLLPGGTGDWPVLPGKAGPVDLSAPTDGVAALACLQELGPAPWAELRTGDGRMAVRLDWSADPWPLAWLWIETGGSLQPPWFGKGRMIAIEPCTTWPATGLAAARAAGGPILTLAPGEIRHARISLSLLPSQP
jgi:hypothetical protein